MATAENKVELRSVVKMVTEETPLVVLTLSPQEARDLRRALYLTLQAGYEADKKSFVDYYEDELAAAVPTVRALYDDLFDSTVGGPAYPTWKSAGD